jgi:hypothetical protein
MAKKKVVVEEPAKESKETYAEHMAKWESKAEKKEAAKEEAKDPMYDDVELLNDSPYTFKIGRKEILPGKNIIKRHQVDSVREMMFKKRYADLRVTQGKSYLTEKLAGNVLSVKEVEKL